MVALVRQGVQQVTEPDDDRVDALLAYFEYRMRRSPLWMRLLSWGAVLLVMAVGGLPHLP